MSFPNKTAKHFYKNCCLLFFLGSPNYWIEDLRYSKPFYKIYQSTSHFINVTIACFIVFELGAFVSQKNLNKKQETDLVIYGVSHPMLLCYSLSLWSNQKNIKKLFSDILRLKSFYNDEKVEKKMLKKSVRDSTALAISCCLAVLLHTTSALTQYIKSEGTFTTVITTWPLVDDPSSIAHVVRVVNNIIWWIFNTRLVASFITIIVLVTSISHQYMNLQSYFCSIEDIFDEDNLNHREKEIKYEESFKLGIKLHSSTVECVDQFRSICTGILSAHIIFVFFTLVFIMTQMMKSERTFVTAAATAITGISVLIGSGFFLWNAGDVTEEAAELPTAMYSSGWHNCHGEANVRVRKLVLVAMTHAQKPVIIKGLGIIDLSYQSYVSLVKFAYSVFSVII